MFLKHLKDKIGKTAANIVFVFIIAFVIFFCFLLYFFISSITSDDTKPQITSSLIYSRIESSNTISSVKYLYTNFGKFEDASEFNGVKIPFSQKSFTISYDGVILAGISIDNIKVDVSGNKIKIDLPKSQIISHEIKEDSIEVFDETKNIFNQISVNDYADFTTEEKKKMEKKAIENGLLIEADKEAQNSVKNILMLYPDICENNEIVFEDFDNSN